MLLASSMLMPFAYAQGADNVSYTATGSPGSAPDGNDTVDVWTVTGDGGSGRSLLKGGQDGNNNVWTIWDLDGGAGTYATHDFAGGALYTGQSVSLDWTHRADIDIAVGVRLLSGTNIEAEFKLVNAAHFFSRYDTGSGVFVDTKKRFDNYDLFRVTFTVLGTNNYQMSVTEGTIADSGFNSTEDTNPAPGDIVDIWTGTFTGAGITGIQIYTEGGNDSDVWYDDLSINDNWLSHPHQESPTLDQTEVAVSGLELSWTIPQGRGANPETLVADPNLVSMNLYINENEPNFISVTPIAVTTWNSSNFKAAYTPAPALNKNTTYFWRVDSVLNNNTVRQGIVWRFETELTRPVIVSNSSYQLVDIGSTANLSVAVESDSPEVYQWYKYVDGVLDIALTDGGDITGANQATLSIANAQPEDDGKYYCVVNNDSGLAVTSAQIMLSTKRAIAYWDFENSNLNSIVPGSPTMLAAGEPSFVPGIKGDGVQFDNSTELIYTDPMLVSYFDICNYGMTVACWVKTNDAQQWAPLVARNGDGGQGWQLRQNGHTANRPSFTTRGTGNDDGTAANRNIFDLEWHFVVGTFDGTVKKVYIDGVLSVVYSTDTGSIIKTGDAATAPINASTSPVAIGGRVSGGAGALNIETNNNIAGIYDEVAIYNYALSAQEVAQIYANISGKEICMSQAYDLSGDCVVNIEDLALMADEWLSDSGITPAVN